MPIDAFVAPLLRLEIFRGLSPQQLSEIARNAERVVLRDGEALITRGELGEAGYVILSGSAIVLEDQEFGAGTGVVLEGSLIGEYAMLVDHIHSTTVVARGIIRALRITRAALHSQMLTDPGLTEHFVAKVSHRLTRMALELRRIDLILAEAARP